MKGLNLKRPLVGLSLFASFVSAVPAHGARHLLPNEYWQSGWWRGAHLNTGDPIEALWFNCKARYNGKQLLNVTAYYKLTGSSAATPDGDGDLVAYRAYCKPSYGRWGGSVRADKKRCGPTDQVFDGLVNQCVPDVFDEGLNAGCQVNLSDGTNPINIATGNKFQKVPVIPQAGVSPLKLSLFFNSSRSDNKHWTHNYASRWIGGLNGSLVSYTSGSFRYRYYIAKFSNADGSLSMFKGIIDPASNDIRWISYSNAEETLENVRDPQTNSLTAVTLRWPDGRSDTFDLSGKLIQRTDTHAKSVYLSYGSNGELESVRDDWGRSMHFSVEDVSQGDQNLIVDYAGSEWRLRYEEDRLVAIQFPGSPASNMQFLYEDPSFPGHLTGIIDERGVRTRTWAYDSEGRGVLSSELGSGRDYAVAYLSSGEREVSTPLGVTRYYSLSPRNGYARIDSQDGGLCSECVNDAVAITYDANGFPATKKNHNGETTALQYDEQGQLLAKIEAAGSAIERKVETVWHPIHGKPTKIIEPGRTTHLDYNEKGQLTSRRTEAVNP